MLLIFSGKLLANSFPSWIANLGNGSGSAGSYSNLDSLFTDIATELRNKLSISDKIAAKDFPEKILLLPPLKIKYKWTGAYTGLARYKINNGNWDTMQALDTEYTINNGDIFWLEAQSIANGNKPNTAIYTPYTRWVYGNAKYYATTSFTVSQNFYITVTLLNNNTNYARIIVNTY